jgi:hypothetical protein
MRKYKCNKEVSAARIVAYEPTFVITDDGSRVDIEPGVHHRLHIDAGRNETGYLVVSKDGHQTYVPKEVFEETYQAKDTKHG